jgi:hypothetical protein
MPRNPFRKNILERFSILTFRFFENREPPFISWWLFGLIYICIQLVMYGLCISGQTKVITTAFINPSLVTHNKTMIPISLPVLRSYMTELQALEKIRK